MICTLFYLEQHLRKLFGALDALQPPFSSNERRKSTHPANDDYLAQNQAIVANNIRNMSDFHKSKPNLSETTGCVGTLERCEMETSKREN